MNFFTFFFVSHTQVLVTKTLNPVANAQLEWTSNEIPARSFISMDIVWNPTIAWSTREVIQFTDNRNFKKDVAVVLKSIDKSQNSKTLLKKSLTHKTSVTDHRVKTKKLALKSPSPRSKMQRNRLSALTVNGMSSKKEMPMNVKNQPKKVLGSNNQSNGFPSVSIFAKPAQIDEKENMQPLSPPNMSMALDALLFTPSSQNKMNTSNVDYLASLPTPTTHTEKYQAISIRITETPSQMYRNMNETQTILSTPQRINDQTTTLSTFQTPMDHSVMDNSRYVDNMSDLNSFAMQKTPACSDGNTFMHLIGAPTPSEPSFISGRRLNLEISPSKQQKEHDLLSVINRTQTLSSPIGLQKLSIIEEEQSRVEMSQTYIKPNENSNLTYNLDENVQTTVTVQKIENLVRDVRLISTPLRKKYLSMKELTETNVNFSLEQQILKNNQGSMPNLHKLETVKSIENNRYFYQSIEKDLQETANANDEKEENENLCDTSICSVKSTVSTFSVGFNENEIKAQSSRLNLNEIGQGKTTKSNHYFGASVEKPAKSMNGINRLTSNKYLSASSPTVNKVFEKPKLSQSIRDISSKGRPSVISYASGRSATPNSGSLKKRNRDDSLDSSRKSINKLSPPKRACIESDSPTFSKGQGFRTKTWGGVMPKKFRIPSVPPQRLQLKRPEEERVILYDPELHLRSKYYLSISLYVDVAISDINICTLRYLMGSVTKKKNFLRKMSCLHEYLLIGMLYQKIM